MITHEQALERLDDFAGGELSDPERRAVQRHLESCADCRDEVATLRALLDEARFLPREIAPERDLWTGIAARLEPRGQEAAVTPLRRRSGWEPPRWVLAAAAAVALVVSTSMLTLHFARQSGTETLPGAMANAPETQAPAAAPRSGTETPIATPAAQAPTALVALQPAEREYQKAVDDLVTVLETRRSQLAPETAAALERNLRIIDQAIAESRAALEKDPNSRELAQMLSAVYDTKVRMLQQVVEL